MDKTKVMKVTFLKKDSLKATMRRCNAALHEACEKFLKTTLTSAPHYAMSELVELMPTHVTYKITLIPEIERMAKEQTSRRIKNA